MRKAAVAHDSAQPRRELIGIAKSVDMVKGLAGGLLHHIFDFGATLQVQTGGMVHILRVALYQDVKGSRVPIAHLLY